MIPLHDNIPSRTTPVVNYAIIAITSFVFILQLIRPDDRPSYVEQYGLIPARVTHPGEKIEVPDRKIVHTQEGDRIEEFKRPAAPAAVPAWLTLVTCIFLHGGWLHILGNMWFLFIFGDNVEDCFGHVQYALFYLGWGVAASGIQLASAADSTIPTIGASGAIAGVMGAYFLLYPKAKVVALVPLFVIFFTVVLPAPLFLGIWFAIQFFQGTVSVVGEPTAGVAWWAHIGGFVAGMGGVWILKLLHHIRPEVTAREFGTDSPGDYRVQRRGWKD